MENASQAPVILITGGSRGVGAATARLAAAQGYDVVISYLSDESAADTVIADVRAAGRQGWRCELIAQIPRKSLVCSRSSTGHSDASMCS